MDEFLTLAKALSDPARVRALMAVRGEELCLCQLIELLGLAPSTVSKHMSLLQAAGLVKRRKEGRWAFYQIDSGSASPQVRDALRWLLESLAQDPEILADESRLVGVCRQDLEELSACYRS